MIFGNGEITSPIQRMNLVRLIADVKPIHPTLLPGQSHHPRYPIHPRYLGEQTNQSASGCPVELARPRYTLQLHPLSRSARRKGDTPESCAWMTWFTRRMGLKSTSSHLLHPEDQIAGFLRLSLPSPDSPATGTRTCRKLPSSVKCMSMVSRWHLGA